METRKTHVTPDPGPQEVGQDVKPSAASGSHEKAASAGGLLERLARLGYRWRWPLLLALLALIFCEVAWLTFLTSTEADLVHYQCYGLTFWLGSHGTALLPPGSCSFLSPDLTPQPLHMLPEEYPPLTIVLFSLPLLLPLPLYALTFALLMTLCAGLIYWLLAHNEARRAAPIFVLYLLLGSVGVFQERFDLVPAACTLVCLLAAERGRWRTAYFALALGVLFKLYPIVMLPALFLAEQRAWLVSSQAQASIDAATSRRRPGLADGKQSSAGAGQPSWLRLAWANVAHWTWTNCLLCLGLIVLVMGAFALLNVQDAILNSLSYFLSRPPQIESLAGSIIWLGGHLGAPSAIHFEFGSLNITSGLDNWISPAISLLTIAGLLTLFWLQWRRRLDLAQSLTGLVCVLIVTGKVFSPQYLIWLLPFLALLAARRQTSRLWMIAWAIISFLTTFIYIFYYSQLPDPQAAQKVIETLPGFFELVALRNALLVLTTLAFLCNWGQARVLLGPLAEPSQASLRV